MTYLVQGADGAIYGPEDVPTLQAWAREGRITPETWLTASAEAPPFHAGEMPDLQAFWPAPSGALAVPAHPCPHCGQPITEGAPFCPHCGYGSGMVPMGAGMPGMPPKQLTGTRFMDFLLGLLPTALLLVGPTLLTLIAPHAISMTSAFCWLVIGMVPAIVALVLLRSYQTVHRGVGTGLALGCAAVPLLLTLGVVSVVTTMLKQCNHP